MDDNKYYDWIEKNFISFTAEEVFLLIKRRLPDAVMVRNRIDIEVNGETFGIDIGSKMPIGDVGRIARALISKIDHVTGKKAA